MASIKNACFSIITQGASDVIHIDKIWLATQPIDMRAGNGYYYDPDHGSIWLCAQRLEQCCVQLEPLAEALKHIILQQ